MSGGVPGPGVQRRRRSRVSGRRSARSTTEPGRAGRFQRVGGLPGRREDRRLVQRAHGVRPARARLAQHSRRPAQPADAGADEHQDQVPRGLPPFAPSVLRERVSDYFELDTDSPYMLLVAPVKKERSIPLTRRAAEAVGHRQAQRAALRHSGHHAHRLLGAHPDRDAETQPALLRADQGVRPADGLSGAWSTRRSTCAASRSSARRPTRTAASCGRTSTPGARAVPARQDRATRLEGDRRMAARVPARLTAAQGRRFGLTVGIAFLVLAGIAWWRGHPVTLDGARRRWARCWSSPGSSFRRTSVRSSGRGWASRTISRVTTPIFMGVVYFVVLTPVGCAATVGGPQSASSPRSRRLVLAHAGRGRPPIRRSAATVLTVDQRHDMSRA